MKKRLALLLAVLMLAASMPVMAMAAPTTGAEQVSVQAKSGWVKSNSRWMYYVNGRALKDTAKKIGTYYYGFDKNGYLCTGFFTLHGRTYYGSTRVGTKKCGAILRGYYHIGEEANSTSSAPRTENSAAQKDGSIMAAPCTM